MLFGNIFCIYWDERKCSLEQISLQYKIDKLIKLWYNFLKRG